MYGRRVHAAVIASGARCAWLAKTRRRYQIQQLPLLTQPSSPLSVISALRRFSGPTVHLVDEEYDRGLILAQRCVPVLPEDTPEVLAQRVLEQARARPGACGSRTPSHGAWRCAGVGRLPGGSGSLLRRAHSVACRRRAHRHTSNKTVSASAVYVAPVAHHAPNAPS